MRIFLSWFGTFIVNFWSDMVQAADTLYHYYYYWYNVMSLDILTTFYSKIVRLVTDGNRTNVLTIERQHNLGLLLYHSTTKVILLQWQICLHLAWYSRAHPASNTKLHQNWKISNFKLPIYRFFGVF